MASSAALCIAVLLLVLAMVNLMRKSLVEGRFLDAGISMVTDQVLPQQQQQQQQTYSSLLPAERFAEVLGNSPSVVSFVAFASKYVFLCFAFLCKLIVCLIDALGRFSLPFYAYVFLREEDVNVLFASSSSRSSTIFFSFFPIRNPSEAVCKIADLSVECCKFTPGSRLWWPDISIRNTAFFSPTATKIQPSFLATSGDAFDGLLVPLECYQSSPSLPIACDCGAEFADLTFDEMRSMYLMNGEQNCSATKGNHVLTNVKLSTEVCPSEYLEILLDTEESHPYTAEDGTCKLLDNKVGAQVYDVVNITEGAENELKHAVATVRPVSVAFEVIDSFTLYKSGVFSDPGCHDSPQVLQPVQHILLFLKTSKIATCKVSQGREIGQPSTFSVPENLPR
ncbi:unnamed protein product [Sphagnum jensenii]